MSKRIRQIIQTVMFTVLITVGIGLVSRWEFSLLPLPQESTHLLRAAVETECISLSQWPDGVVAEPSPFHQAAGICARFFGEGKSQLPIRCYRVFPSIFSILFLLALPALGLRRRGGVFESADGPLWALAFAVASPAVIWNGNLFTPFSFLLFCFLFFLLAARSYAQWPGFTSAISVGTILAISFALDATTIWAVVVLVPTIAIGVGWRRLRLYWRTTHFLSALAASLGLVLLFTSLGIAQRPTVPMLPAVSADWAMAFFHNLLWFSAGGLGLFAWVVLAILGGFRPDRRWLRLLTLLFPCCVLAGTLFGEGNVFFVMIAALTPIMIGVMLSEVPIAWLRGVQGVILWCGLAVWTYLIYTDAEKKLLTRPEARETIAALVAVQDAPRVNTCRTRIYASENETVAQLIWPIRHFSGYVECGSAHAGGNADIHVIPKAVVDSVPLAIRTNIRLGEIKLDRTSPYVIFATSIKQETEQ